MNHESKDAKFIGWQLGYGALPDFPLFNLKRDIPGHCTNSTVALKTLVAAGLEVPDHPPVPKEAAVS